MRPQVVGEENGLGPLKVGVTRKSQLRNDRIGIGGPLGKNIDKMEKAECHLSHLPSAPQSKRGGHLIVATPARVESCPGIPGKLCHPALDRRMDVLVPLLESELTPFHLVAHRDQGVVHRLRVRGIQNAGAPQHRHVGPAPLYVVAPQAGVESDAVGVSREGGCARTGEAAVPERRALSHTGRR